MAAKKQIGESEMIFRAAAHGISRARRRGNLSVPADLAQACEDLFRAMADETAACGDNTDAAQAILRDALDEGDDDGS